MTIFQTPRLTLTPCAPSDASDFIDLELDPEVMRYLNGGHAVDPAQVDPNAACLIEWGFRSHGYDKIVSCTMAVHRGSRRVMEKIGMRYARRVFCEGDSFPGTQHGEVWYELTRSDFYQREER